MVSSSSSASAVVMTISDLPASKPVSSPHSERVVLSVRHSSCYKACFILGNEKHSELHASKLIFFGNGDQP